MTMTDTRKTYNAHIRLTRQEHERIAAASGGNMSRWFRAVALDAMANGGPHLHADMLDIRNQLAALGNNLNQLARRVNAGVAVTGLQEAADEVRVMALRVTKVLRKVR
ncbi:hypothetical protein NJLHNGOC_04145 [Novacetimonas cocois]|uniref:Uncharacterized protein n=2 Tax=Novacetimonas cocois TaxID=1747507 RepID=A0A365YYT1_9PROT|nr:hypothetical protein NJLHNGOC_04145 [Novacetimonas cocois]